MLKLYRKRTTGGILVNRGSIKAVHDSKLDEYLSSIGVLDQINSGKAYCSICGKKITLENFQCVYPKNEKIMICCSNLACFKAIIREGEIIVD